MAFRSFASDVSASADPGGRCQADLTPRLVREDSVQTAFIKYRGERSSDVKAVDLLHRKFGGVIKTEEGVWFINDMAMIQAIAVNTKDVERDWRDLNPYLGKDSFFIKENHIPEERDSWQTVFDAIRPQLRQKAVEAQSGRLKHAVVSALNNFMNDANDEISLEEFSFYMAFSSAMRFLFDYVPSKSEVDTIRKRADGVFMASKFNNDGKKKRMGLRLEEMARQIENHGEFHSSETSIYAALKAAQLEKAKTDPSYNDQWLRDQLKTVIWASFETTQSLAGVVLYYAAHYPEWAEKVRLAYLNVGNNPPERDRTIAAFINEALRLHPPIPSFARVALHDFEINGYRIPKGTPLILNLYSAHRDADVWGDDARFFRPERWLNGASEITSCKLDETRLILPFGAGARRCIGQYVAMGEIANMLGQMLTRYKIKMESMGFPFDYDGTLRPQFDGILKIRPREQ